MTSAVSRSWKQTILDQNLVLFWSCSIYYRKPSWMVYIKGTDRFWVARVLPWKTWKWEKFSKSLSRYIVHPSLYFLKISRNSVKCVNLWRVNLWTTTVSKSVSEVRNWNCLSPFQTTCLNLFRSHVIARDDSACIVTLKLSSDQAFICSKRNHY